jgi:hypothetical protein
MILFVHIIFGRYSIVFLLLIPLFRVREVISQNFETLFLGCCCGKVPDPREINFPATQIETVRTTHGRLIISASKPGIKYSNFSGKVMVSAFWVFTNVAILHKDGNTEVKL